MLLIMGLFYAFLRYDTFNTFKCVSADMSQVELP